MGIIALQPRFSRHQLSRLRASEEINTRLCTDA